MENESWTGGDALAAELANNGVECVFCITGAGNLAIVDAIYRRGDIRLIYVHHEQAAVMSAQGYSRVTGKLGVALVTTGGGAANAVIGALSAQLDSIPTLVIAGNESSLHCRTMRSLRAYGVQGFDSARVYEPITKSATRIESVEEIGPVLRDSIATATKPRSGVCFVEVPMDLQRAAALQSDYGDGDNRVSQEIAFVDSDTETSEWAVACWESLCRAERPILYFGDGIRRGGARDLALAVAERYGLPFFVSWSALDIVPDDHPLNMGRVGIYGDRAANLLLQKSDFLLCVGTRLAIPQVGYDQDDFARNAERWVVDVDPTELGKLHGSRWRSLAADAVRFLRSLDSVARPARQGPNLRPWLEECERIWSRLPRNLQVGPPTATPNTVHSFDVISSLNEALSDDAVVVTDVGAGLLTGHYALQPHSGQRVFTSQGLGEMGFGLPAAIGACIAEPTRQVVCLDTDGALMFNLQELQTVQTYGLALKLLVFNNQGYGMIRISQENLFGARYTGVGTDTGLGFPDYEKLAALFGFSFLRIDSDTTLQRNLSDALDGPGSTLIEVVMSPEQKYLPRVATHRAPDGSLVSPPLEDMEPMISISELEDLLGYPPTRASFAARGLDIP